MQLNQELHIVSFTIPYPANYGGVIDVFYKIKALSKLGVKINLHCFQYDREESNELRKYCKSVNYYYRPKKLNYFFSGLPFVVNTRSNKTLLKTLQADHLPVLFEGLHTTYFLKKLTSSGRQLVVRTHNIEHEYYANLAKQEKNLFHKIFFYSEAYKLKRYQKILESNIKIAAITENDCNYFKSINSNVFLIEAFHPFKQVEILTGLGNYVLFHGNLSVNENISAAKFIVKQICSKVDYPFIFAGKDPDKSLKKLIDNQKNAKLIENPSEEIMQDLIKKAQINLLITFQATGIKLKLINALFNGRHCIANPEMVSGSGLDELCYICKSPDEIVLKIKELLTLPYEEKHLNKRKEALLKNVNNEHNAQKLINLLFKN